MTVADRATDVVPDRPAGGMHRVGARPPLLAYLSETWDRRDFAITLARSRLQSANEENRLGVLWIGLRPLINAAIYGFIFGVLQGANRPPDYISFVLIGVFLYEYSAGCMIQGARSITGNRPLVQSLAFPRITLPLAAVIEQFLSLMVILAVMLVLVVAFGTAPRFSWLLLVPLVLLYSLFNAGVALICARLTVIVTDLSQLLPYVSRMLMYLSGVLFQPERLFKTRPNLIALYEFHPIYEVMRIARGILLYGDSHAFDPIMWVYLACWAFGLLTVGVIVFWVAEEQYGRVT